MLYHAPKTMKAALWRPSIAGTPTVQIVGLQGTGMIR